MSELILQDNKKVAGFMDFSNLENAKKCAAIILDSGFCPKNYKSISDILVAIQLGAELGLSPLPALQNIAVINGKPSIYGDAMLAIASASGHLEYCSETFDEKTMTATCKVKRKGRPEEIRTFSKQDAIQAGLWGKQGPWITYPKRMLQFRARGFNLRDNFSDYLGGFVSAEEARDYTVSEKNETTSRRIEKDVTPEEHVSNSMDIPTLPDDVLHELVELMESSDVSEDTRQRWLEKASVSSIHNLSVEQAKKIIEHLKTKTKESTNESA